MMGRVLKGEIGTAVRMLRRNRGRSLLTMLGIIIGVASVVTVAAIGQGISQQVAQQTERLGSDLITVRPGQITSSSGVLSGFANGSASYGTLSTHDVAVIAAAPNIKTAVPLSIVSANVQTTQNNSSFTLPVIGTTPDFPAMLDQSVAYGSFLDGQATDANKVILGAHAAEAMFTQNVPLGQTVRILGQSFIVAGILKEAQTPPLSLDLDFNNAVIMGNDEAQILTNNSAHIYEILARPVNASQTNQVVDQLRGLLLAAHGGQQDFVVLKQDQTMAVSSTILNLVTALIAGVAAIALLVGGVGIMNVMLVSVTERMHEIGIRKAVGATNRQILRQFIIEAAVLSITGAVIGIIVALFIAVTLQLTTSLAPAVTWQAVVLACFAAVLIGIVFGIAPALKASRRDPISALRNV